MLRLARSVPRLAGYGLSALMTVVVTLAALGLCAVLRPASPGHIAAPLLLLPVVLSARYGGLGPALLAAVLSVGSLVYFFEPPVYNLELDLRDGLRLGAFVFTAILIATLNSRRRRVEASLRATEIELAMARTIQQKLFPPSALRRADLEAFGSSTPATATGGDYFDFIPMRRGAVGVVIGDVSGHGLGPAILMAETRAYLRALALGHDDPGEILTRLNELLAADVQEEQFCTLFFARFDPAAGCMVYAAAGHEAHLFEPGGEVRKLPGMAPPLGIDARLVVPCAAPLPLRAGQVYLLATDGVSDACAPDGRRFGAARALDVVRAHSGEDARGIHDRLSRALRDFSAEAAQPDDTTLLVLKILE